MWHLFPTELMHPAWCLPLILFGLLFMAWWRKKTNINQKIQIFSISWIPILYNYLLYFIKYFMDSTHNPHPSEYFLPIVSGISHLYYQHKMVKVALGNSSYIYCFEASTCESILKSSVALNKNTLYNAIHHWLGKDTLFTSETEKWKVRKKMLNPAFNFRLIKDFIPIFNEKSMVMIEKLKKCCGKKIAIKKDLQLCAMNIIGETFMGIDMKDQEKEVTEYFQEAEKLITLYAKWLVTPWYWMSSKILWSFASDGRIVQNGLKTMHSFSRKILLDRKATALAKLKNSENCKENGENVPLEESKLLLDILLHHHITHQSLSMEDVQREIDVFFQAGQGSIDTTISWTLYLLGLHKDIQETLYQEIQSVFGDNKERLVTMDDIREIKYVECVLKESMRVFPPAPFIGRRTTEDIKSGPYTIPANSSILISIYDVHRDPAIFPNPEVFDPNRFLPENSSKRHPFTFLPFSVGPRNCIGKSFAMMEMNVLLINFLRNFKVHSLDQRDKIILVASVVLYAKNGLKMILEKR